VAHEKARSGRWLREEDLAILERLMSTFGVRSSSARGRLMLASVCVVSACRYGYELVELESGAGGSGSGNGGATMSGGTSSVNGGSGSGLAGEGGEPGVGGSGVEGGTGGASAGTGNGATGATTQGGTNGGGSAGSGSGGTASTSGAGGKSGTGGASAGSSNGGSAGASAGSANGGAAGASAGSSNGGTAGAAAGAGAGGAAGASAGSSNGGTAGAAAGAGGAAGASAGSSNGGTAGAGGAAGASAGSSNGGTAGAGAGGAGGAGGTSGMGGSGGGSGAGGLVVTTNADENDAGATASMPGGTGLSLREAITIANATAGAQTITFQNGVVVALTNTLPTITGSTTILGGNVNGTAVASGRDCLVVGAGPSLVDGLRVTNCRGKPISVTGGNDVHISNCTLTQNAEPLEVGTVAGTGTIIGPGNVITGSAGHCVAVYNSGTLVLDNRIIGCGTDGIFVSGRSATTSLIGNLIVRAETGIGMAVGATGTVMWFNTVAQSVLHGINVGNSSTNDLRNNILAFNGDAGVWGQDSRFSQQNYNLFFGNTTGTCSPCIPGQNSVFLDPRFVNTAADDYTLQAGSPAINAGTPVAADRNGAGAGNFNGTAPDLGYWESP
jgi:hypothetical protein